jgi:hypothetical protein
VAWIVRHLVEAARTSFWACWSGILRPEAVQIHTRTVASAEIIESLKAEVSINLPFAIQSLRN